MKSGFTDVVQNLGGVGTPPKRMLFLGVEMARRKNTDGGRFGESPRT